MDTKAEQTVAQESAAKKLTLDKILGPDAEIGEGKTRKYGYPAGKNCKNCQHCNSTIVPGRARS